MNRRIVLCCTLVAVSAMAMMFSTSAEAGFRASAYGIHMDPSGRDAKDFSRASYGGGLHASMTLPGLGRIVSGGIGLEIVGMLSETHEFQDPKTLLRVEQQTSQDYFRLFLGPEFGPTGSGFFRPHVGAHVAFVNYGISTDVVVPDDAVRETEIRQNLRSENRPVFGYDFDAGANLSTLGWE